jgi:type II restriction/modification system DNA methylase subunit YeeA
VLDPACGSGNFLYMALVRLKDFDRAVQTQGRALDLPPDDERVGPQSVLGIEVNPYAAELARTTVWIGELQWQRSNTGPIRRAPVLGRLDGIECRDALLNADGTEAAWPKADAIVGNPPFLGNKKQLSEMNEAYLIQLRSTYSYLVPKSVDLICYWIYKVANFDAKEPIYWGFVVTNSIRSGKNVESVKISLKNARLISAWSDEEWVVNGAAVRVSLICFGPKNDRAQIKLNGNKWLIPLPTVNQHVVSGVGLPGATERVWSG